MISKKTANVDKNRCVSCGACYNTCPRKAISIVHGCFAEVDIEKCVGCGMCFNVCPAGCITIISKGDKI
ncbi:MAG: 4Fe-4S binding protein [Clostridium sp.]|uniref:4Fe-4S binding protein n=1 Tax=Clostridium sp. DSM 8431 TaxID=1761781 RepID=UPI0008EB951D|nr:4Fe-4S binding protein [Clostridium sp. DSM 8431]MCR4943338.1 4Fe-4S binding protein [Clostridium sp.]SFU35721.1 4Fe-4S dicluster domain-containing protein [Clostridium sp. DSM 8431]